MLYPALWVVERATRELAGRPRDIPFFGPAVIDDPLLAARFRRFHHTAEMNSVRGRDGLELESRLLDILASLAARHAADRPQARPVRPEPRAARVVREYLQAHHADKVTLAELARVAAMSPFHLVRVFHATIGLPPHAYLEQVRVHRAKALLAAGVPATRVAVEVGFVDQSHLTKRFKRLVGVAPGAYQRGVLGGPPGGRLNCARTYKPVR